MACDLREHCSYRGLQREVLVFHEKATNATKVDAAKEVMEIDVEDKPPSHVCPRVRHDRVLALEAVRYAVMLVVFDVPMTDVDFRDAVLKQLGKAILEELQVLVWCPNFPRST